LGGTGEDIKCKVGVINGGGSIGEGLVRDLWKGEEGGGNTEHETREKG
jgi:hypothetical protein